MKVVINECFGGFSLSDEAMQLYASKKGIELGEKLSYGYEKLWDGDIDRNDPVLVEVVEELGAKANGDFAELKIVEIPDGIVWHISDYDGVEHVAEYHRTWS